MDPRPITLSDIDTTRALRTDNELIRLVAAIHGSRPEAQETNWLERKSTLDLSVAAGKFAVATGIRRPIKHGLGPAQNKARPEGEPTIALSIPECGHVSPDNYGVQVARRLNFTIVRVAKAVVANQINSPGREPKRTWPYG